MSNLRLTANFRPDAFKHQHHKGASAKNPGGGLARKAEHLQLALPSLEFVPYLNQAGDIHITEQLWFSRGPNFSEEVMNQRIEEYEKCSAYKILWTSDLESLRWKGSEAQAIFDASDVIACNSQYMLDLLSVYADTSKLAVLTDPVDPNWVYPQSKKRQIYGCSQIVIEKGIQDVVEIFEGLSESDIERIFVGSVETWGMTIKPSTSYKLDRLVTNVCDRRLEFASRQDVRETAAQSWLFVSFAKFESFGYAMIEALLAGCWVFCGNHHVYRDRPVFDFDNAKSALSEMLEFINSYSLEDVNEEGREFVIENYGLDVFRKQFRDIIVKGIY